MKNYITTSLFLVTIFLFSCSSSQKGIHSTNLDTPTSLQDRLLQKSGVFFHGNQVRIRGGDQSFFGDSEPLFEINGQVLSGGFAAANNLVNAVEIKSITVLKNPAELSMYGVRGSNGVIKIKLKNSGGN